MERVPAPELSIRELEEAWLHYIRTGERDSRVRAVIYDSWQRCRQYFEQDPYRLRYQTPDRTGLAEARAASALLLNAARPYLEAMHGYLRHQPHMIALGDPEAHIVLLLADHTALHLGESANLWEGASWSERDLGCNGIGTALVTEKPVLFVGPEHYVAQLSGWTCMGVPVHGPDGKVVGALDLSVPNEALNADGWAWMLAIAQAVEEDLRTPPETERTPEAAWDAAAQLRERYSPDAVTDLLLR